MRCRDLAELEVMRLVKNQQATSDSAVKTITITRDIIAAEISGRQLLCVFIASLNCSRVEDGRLFGSVNDYCEEATWLLSTAFLIGKRCQLWLKLRQWLYYWLCNMKYGSHNERLSLLGLDWSCGACALT